MRGLITFIVASMIFFCTACGGKTQETVDLGGGKNWSEWRLTKDCRVVNDAVVIPENNDALLKIDPTRLSGKRLGYEVEGPNGGTVRWQINWHDAADKFVNTTITLHVITNGSVNYEKNIVIPTNAAIAYVYLSRHGVYKGDVKFKRVYLSPAEPEK